MSRRAKFSVQKMEKGTVQEDVDFECSKYFAATVVSALVSFPLLLWGFSILRRVVAQANSDFDCQLLLIEKPLFEAALALSVIFMLLVVYLGIAIPVRNWFAISGLSFVVIAAYCVFIDFPDLGNKTVFGIYDSPSPPSTILSLANNNNNNNVSDYWKNNVKTCFCATEACEETVYWRYFQGYYDGDVSNYTKLSSTKDEVKNGSEDVLLHSSSNAHRHAVCYTSNVPEERNKTLCIDCQGCEDQFLINVQKSRWRLGNKLYAINILLTVANAIVFLAEVMARNVA